MKNFINIFEFLPENLFLRAKILVVLTVILVFLEILSLGSIVPLLTSISSSEMPNFINKMEINFLKNKSKDDLILIFIILFFLIYLIKILFNIFYIYFSNKFTFDIYSSLSNRLFKIYINQNWLFYLNYNTAFIIRNIIGEANTVRVSFIEPSLRIFSEIFVFCSIVLLLLFVEIKITLILIFSIILIILLYKKITKPLFFNLGKIRLESSGLLNKTLIQTFNLVKEIKILNKQNYFLEEYKKVLKNYLDSTRKSNVQVSITRQVFEIVALLVLIVMMFFFLNKETAQFNNSIPIIGLFLGSAYRILPSANQLLNSLQRLDLGKKSLNLILKILNDNKDIETPKSENTFFLKKDIVFENVSFSYEEVNRLFDKLNLQIKKNEIIGIVGGSGQGKTTFINLLAGFLKPDSGKIKVDNQNIHKNESGWQNNIGIVQQEIYLVDDTIKKNIAFGLEDSQIDNEKIDKVLEAVELKDFVNSLPQKEETIVGEKGQKISAGQKQRIGIARMLYANKKLLIFDESTNALDKETEREIIEFIKTLKKEHTIIMISHDLENLKICDAIIDIKKIKLN
mgnify:CR=1 FL=1